MSHVQCPHPHKHTIKFEIESIRDLLFSIEKICALLLLLPDVGHSVLHLWGSRGSFEWVLCHRLPEPATTDTSVPLGELSLGKSIAGSEARLCFSPETLWTTSQGLMEHGLEDRGSKPLHTQHSLLANCAIGVY